MWVHGCSWRWVHSISLKVEQLFGFSSSRKEKQNKSKSTFIHRLSKVNFDPGIRPSALWKDDLFPVASLQLFRRSKGRRQRQLVDAFAGDNDVNIKDTSSSSVVVGVFLSWNWSRFYHFKAFSMILSFTVIS